MVNHIFSFPLMLVPCLAHLPLYATILRLFFFDNLVALRVEPTRLPRYGNSFHVLDLRRRVNDI
jgi:hypothetical protein